MSFKLPSMSINKMIHHNDSEQHQIGDTIQKMAKVKVFYSFKDNESTCLCTFDLQLSSSQPTTNHWIPISLKKCLLSVCSSCPNQLLQNDNDMAIYTVNVEESNIGPTESLRDARSKVIWEGHGLLSTVLREDVNESIMVSGQIVPATMNESYDYIIQVLLQMHPIRRSQEYNMNMTTTSMTTTTTTTNNNTNINNTNTLPSMKSILSSDEQMYTSPPYHATNLPDNRSLSTSPTTKLSSFKPYSQTNPSLRSDIDFNHSLANTSPPYQSETPSEWSRRTSPPHPYEDTKRRKLTPPLNYPSTSSPPQQPIYPSPHPPQRSPPNSLLPLTRSPPPLTSHHYNHHHPNNNTNHHTINHTNNNNNSNNNTNTNNNNNNNNNTNRKTNVDTFYHQSRRKKRDTKPPNANDVRPYVQVEKGLNGKYILPVEVDSWTVISLGDVVWDREAFHNQRYIYPVGYCVKKWYRSMVDPHSDTQYTCQILDGGDEPIFQLEADDNPGEVYAGPTTTTIWTIVVRRAFAIRNMEYGHNPVGPDFFGLRKNTIAKMIQDLPNADKCKNYVWQTFEAITTNGSKGKAMRRSNTRASTSSSSTSSASEPTTTPLPQSTRLKQTSTSPMSEDIPVA
ncbi:unnamed protein product [Cunninghamella blakesleeana]